MATHSSILAWRIPWTEEPGGLQSTGSQRVRHDFTFTFTFHFQQLTNEQRFGKVKSFLFFVMFSVMHDLSSLTKDQSLCPCSGSMES